MTSLLEKLKEIPRSFVHTPRAMQLVWQTNRWATIGLGGLTLGGALLPASQAWVGKLIVDGVVASIQGGADPERVRRVFVYLILELALFGCALAWLRARTDSVFPGMLVHATFNATALIVVVLVA